MHFNCESLYFVNMHRKITVVLGRHYELIPRRWRGPRAQYIVFAGLVFVPLSSELMESCRVKAKSLGLTYAAEAQVRS